MKDKSVFVDMERELREICVQLKVKGRVMLQDFDLTPPQFDALLHLVKDGDQTLGDLSNKMYLACSTITDLLDRMEKTGLVSRVKDDKDKRITRVVVLPKGHGVIERVLEARRQFLANVLEGMSDMDLQKTLKTITALNAYMMAEEDHEKHQ